MSNVCAFPYVALAAVATSTLTLTAMAGDVPLPNHYSNGTNYFEANYVVLQFPASMLVVTGQTTPVVYGRIYNFTFTEAPGPNGNIVAQFGYGPIGSNPLVDDSQWTWVGTTFNVQVGNDDEYQTSITAPAPGVYAYTFRFNLFNYTASQNVGWTLADLNGAGNYQQNSFDPNQLGVMTVTPTPGAAAVLGIGALAGMRRRR